MEKKTRTIFTKKFMINELKKMREDLIENQMITSEITKKYSTLYCYKIFENLIFRGYIKMVDKQGKTNFYRWNFDRKLNYNLFDLLYNHGLKERNKIQQKSKNVNKNLILQEPQIELINSNSKFKNTGMFLAKQIRKDGENWFDALKRANEILRVQKLKRIKEQIENYKEKANLQHEEPILEPVQEVIMQEVKLPAGFQMWNPVAQARYLGLVPNEEEIQGLKDEIEDLKIQLDKKTIVLKDLKAEMERKDNSVYSLVTDYQNKLYEQEKHYEKHYEKLLSEKTLEPTFVPKEEDKKPLVSVLDEIKKQKIESQKPVKYLKIFGIKIYEKN
jgi:hypothetical protein